MMRMQQMTGGYLFPGESEEDEDEETEEEIQSKSS